MPEDSVIITGSGSVSVDLPEGYTGETGTKGRKKFHDAKANLVRVEVNGVKIKDLGKHDVVKVVTDDGTP